jgi:hypothetical protein
MYESDVCNGSFVGNSDLGIAHRLFDLASDSD